MIASSIRPETPDDRAPIHELTRRAFAPMPYAGGDEQDVVARLRDRAALSLSLVAEIDGALSGHLALSPATHESGARGWYALGPVSVEPGVQRKGVGSALIEGAKTWLRGRDARGCILTGDPRYYERFGFYPASAHAPAGEPEAYFQVWVHAGSIPAGRFRFHPAFYG